MGNARARSLVIVALLALTAFLVASVVARSGRSDNPSPAPSTPARAALPSPLRAATAPPAAYGAAEPGAAASPAGVHRALARVLTEPGFGGRLLAHVVDAQTGAVLYDSFGSTPGAPASTAKLLTAAAILGVHAPTYRFTTEVVDAGDGTIVIVGGGDPTLSGARTGKPTPYAGAARMSDLVAQVKRSGVTVRHIVVDGDLFQGASISTYWDRSDMGTGYGAPITAFMADGARPSPTSQARSGVQPDLDAGAEFAALLGVRNVPVTPGHAPTGTKVLARVQSAPLSELITEMLQESDNIIAEVLARQVAIGEHVRASFAGATAAIRTVLARFGVEVGAGMKDGSGLSSYDRVSPTALVGVLRLVAGAAGPPAAAQLHFIAGALPVGGWSGTLANRYDSGALAAAAGRVRAKTGSLSTVASLAGFVHDKSGRLLVFSLDADRAVGVLSADAALDDVVGVLAECGCS